MLDFTLSTLALLLATVAAAPTPATHVLHERRSESAAWVKLNRVHEDVKLPMRIGLTQSNLHNADEYLMKVLVFSPISLCRRAYILTAWQFSSRLGALWPTLHRR